MNRRTHVVGSAALLACALQAAAQPQAPAKNPIQFPHPQITEVLYDVPQGSTGDANKDGQRSAAGDEFIEIANPYDEAIELEGYVITNRRAPFDGSAKGGVRFVFPKISLAPHAVAVVFNGHEAAIPEPVGTGVKAPESGNDRFAGALVFTIENSSSRNALANEGDWVVLWSPEGQAIDCVAWGDPSPTPPTEVLRAQHFPDASPGSVQRLKPDAPMRTHSSIDGARFSPGMIPTPKTQPVKTKGKKKSTR